ncbi:MAG: hypothetical protein LBH87_02260 [Coriobacteriales bacterium]|nr:hypothetical protein [Coriobacteriales bacterium]
MNMQTETKTNEQLKTQLTVYLDRGSATPCSRCLGLELEHFIVDETARKAVFFEDSDDGRPGVESILRELAQFYQECQYAPQPDGSQRLIGLSRPNANITLEPGAQLEISIGPVFNISSLEALYQAFRSEIDPILAHYSYRLLALGTQPFAEARSIPLLPKQRYHWMDEYFKNTGKHGICMMRASASCQVSIDFSSESDALRKLKVANALSPLFYFITDNSPSFETLPLSRGVRRGGTELLTASGLEIPPRMVRAAIWNDVDPWRSCIAPGSMADDYRFSDYSDFLLSAPAIFSEDILSDGSYRSNFQNMRTNADVFATLEPTKDIVEHILSLFFFDNRLKTYVEIRMADSMPPAYALAFSALTTGIFYDEENLNWLAEALANVDEAAIAEAKAGLMENAWGAYVYGRSVADWLCDLLSRATTGLDENDHHYLQPLIDLVESRKTLAIIQMRRLENGEGFL